MPPFFYDLWCRRIFSDSVIANFLLVLTVKELCELRRTKMVPVFGPPCTVRSACRCTMCNGILIAG